MDRTGGHQAACPIKQRAAELTRKFSMALADCIRHAAAMRISALAITFGMLTGILVAMWAHRFVPVDGAAAVHLDALVMLDAAPPGFTRHGDAMQIAAGGAAAGAPFAIPGAGESRHFHVRFHATARELIAGAERWEDGRLLLEWLDAEGQIRGSHRLHSARDDTESGNSESVVSAPRPGLTPILRFQNHGQSGIYQVDFLEITPVRERAIWAIGKFPLALGFLATLAAFHLGTKKPARWRGWVVAGIWMIVAFGYAFPGPWEAAMPYAVPFNIPEAEPMQPGDLTTSDMPATPVVPPVVEVEPPPPPNDLGLRLKVGFPWLRPLLHIVLFSVPVFAMAWFVGARTSMWLGFLLSISVEASQTLYGFGFGWDDVGDLIVNAIAIFGALWIYQKIAPRIANYLPFLNPNLDR